MRNQWRLVLDPPLGGRENMDRDLAYMEEVATGQSPPTLRLYRWSPPTLSLGYFQEIEEVVDLDACRRAGVEVVRRPTGGRAVFHDKELTYSIIVSEAHPFINKGGVVDAYHSISRGILTAFNLVGITASLAPEGQQRAARGPGACFDTPSAYEIKVEGKKVVGSAQLRREGVLLQHGSILFRLQPELYRALLRRKKDEAKGEKVFLEDRAAGLHDLGFEISCERMTRALVKAFTLVIPAAFSSLDRRIKPKGD